MLSMSVEAQPLDQKHTEADGTWDNVSAPSKRHRVNRSATTKFVFLMLAVILMALVLLLVLATALAVYYGVAHGKCSEDKTQPSVDQKKPPRYASRIARDVRLPKTVVPHSYDLVLQAHLNKSNSGKFFFNGSVSIKLYCQKSNDSIFLHAHSALDVSTEQIYMVALAKNDSNMRRSIPIKNIIYDNDSQWYQIELTEKLNPGSMYEITFPQFTSELARVLEGWYLSSYNLNGSIKYLAASQLQPTDARRVFPCLDEPEFKAQFQVSIIYHEEYHALANMPRQSTKPLGDGWHIDTFEPTVKMSTYLLAFVVSQFESVSTTDSKGRTITIWARPDEIHLTNYALGISTKLLTFFEDYFGTPYIMNKTDMVAIPDFKAGAMENWGLILYREESLLWNPENGTAFERQRVAVVIAHELAHQWFGNLVTMNWWDDIWLNEGFASFAEHLGIDHVHPEFEMDEQFLVTYTLQALVSDSVTPALPVVRPVHYPEEINSMFNNIAYKKGSSILQMVKSFMGRDLFKRAVKHYLHEHQYNNTNHEDLWRALTEEAKQSGKTYDMKVIMENWMKQGSYPLVTIERVGPNLFRFQQTHYLNESGGSFTGTAASLDFNWQIPITYGSANTVNWDELEVIWLKDKTMMVELPIPPNTWYLINAKQTGFYRVHYADSNWELLTAQLHKNYTAIPSYSRTQILSDLLSIASRGNAKFSVYLNLISYISEEQNYATWWMVKSGFYILDRMLAPYSIYGKFQAYFCSLVNKQLQSIDWTTIREDTHHMKHLLRELIIDIACRASHPLCLKKSREMFSDWMRNPSENKIPPSIRKHIYCTAIRHGGLNEWNFLSKQRNEKKANICSALFCTREIWLIKRLIEHEGCKRERFDTTTNNVGQTIIWQRVVTQWNLVGKNNTPQYEWENLLFYFSMLNSQQKSIDTVVLINQLDALPDINSTKANILRYDARHTLEKDEKWLKINLENIVNWLNYTIDASSYL